jgi:DNA helicase II / ATP-dependent DNA helicase PcrA
MAMRKFTLPGIQELTKEQEDARALPKKGQHLIIGGPGTGKSVLALLRSRRHYEDRDNYVFLVYNHLLNEASRHLFGQRLTSQTWQSWFHIMFHKMTGQAIPRLQPQPGKIWQEIDWEQVRQVIGALDSIKAPPNLLFLIIDEGQDMPPEFYQALANLGFENFYVVADQNQQIVSGKNSSRRDIENALAIDTDNVIELTENYRNSHPTARLAREFYTGDPASPPPELPSIQRTAQRPILVEYGSDGLETFHSVVDTILKTADRDPSRLLGIVAPNNDIRMKYFKALSETNMQLDNGMPLIRTYESGGDVRRLSFDQGGILVINAQSCKGLEFDTVILADIDRHICYPAIQDAKKRLFYVMIARARDNVIMLKNAGNHCPVDAILPNNQDVLERRR